MAVPSVSFEAWQAYGNWLYAHDRSTSPQRQCLCFNALIEQAQRPLRQELEKRKNELEKQKKELDEQKNELEKQKKQVAGLLQTVARMRVALGVEVQAVPNFISDVESTDGTSENLDSDDLDSDDCDRYIPQPIMARATNNKRRKLVGIVSAPSWMGS